MRNFGAILMVFLLGGCLGGYSPANRFYYLQVVDAVEPVSSKKLNIGIDSVELPDYLDRPQIIVFEQGSPQMKIDETNRWGEALATMVQRTVTTDIAAYLPKATVKSKTALDERFRYLVDIEIVRLDMIGDDGAVLEAWWSVYDDDGRRIVQQKTALKRKIDGGFDAYVEAESEMIAEMSRQIAQVVAKVK